ncbi:tetratricopeptide repeat protein [Azovibrio restrictus]|uniref:tetratricopeptide repeat protein n=1 Tax=Azovibrio restrictus TaxID=146938 RepID=UPI0026EE6750|nr:tetratricopeptide repeat protein [Azovibrio restrictus]MDD3482636.1 tetratricopeptide repeat protein [Azovibrio restrictus]
MRPFLIALDTAWGSRHGGINAFNTELLKALAIQPDRHFDVACVLLQVEEAAIAETRRAYHLPLHSLGLPGGEFSPEHASRVIDCLRQAGIENFDTVIWLGHDDKTGPLALALREQYGGRVALVHHMAHAAYQSYKKGDSLAADEKAERQRLVFRQADYLLAVGPRLKRELEQLLHTEQRKLPVHMLVPGLAEPQDVGVFCPEEAPPFFGGFAAGRLGAEDDRIKQGRLALRAFAQEVKKAREEGMPQPLLDGARFCLMGIDADQEATIRRDLEHWAEACLQVDLQPFCDDRETYFRKLAASSFAMMLSWHEGFGLTGWEAIAAGVPLVLGKNSGLYQLLQEEFQGLGTERCLFPLDIRGHQTQGTDEENHRPGDVAAVGRAIRKLAADPAGAKKAAVRLRKMIAGEAWDWRRTARDLIAALDLPMPADSTARMAVLPSQDVAVSGAEALPAWLAPPARPAWNPAWGWSPAVLLQAASAVVPFDPARQPLLDRLIAWAENADYPIKLSTYTGPGGTGKTRLALEAARHLGGLGWQTFWLSSDKPADWLAQWQQHWRSGQATFLVVDYAETRGDEIRDLLVAAMAGLEKQGGAQLRLVLLARNADSWWQALCEQAAIAPLLTGPATAPPQLIPPLQDEVAREAAFRSALQAFAAAQGMALPANHYQPPLADTLYQRPLYLQLAALAALEGRAPASAATLLEAQLNREWGYWRRGPGRQHGLREEWASALALFALCGGCPNWQTAVDWLADLAPASASGLAQALAETYPAGGGAIAPLQPDLLAELLLHQCLLEERGKTLLGTALRRAPRAALTFLGRFCAEGNGRQPLAEAEGGALVAALAEAWPSLGQMAVDVAHENPPGLGKWLVRAWKKMAGGSQKALSKRLELPRYSVCLLELAVDVARARLGSAGEYPEQRAKALNNLAVCLSELGDAASRAEALEYAREAVKTYRGLADSQPSAYLPDLAMSLNNLAAQLSAQGDAASRAEALGYAREAVSIRRKLADSQPSAYLPDLAMSLNNLAAQLSAQGDAASRAEALGYAREAVSIRRKLADSQPSAYLPDLAMSLNTLANRLSEQGDAVSRAEALGYAREAVKTYRGLAESQPSAYLPYLAGSLNNLAVWLAAQGNAASRAEALEVARESVSIRKKLADSQPSAYLPDLAGSLNNLANRLSEQGDVALRAEALEYAREAVRSFVLLYSSMPDAFESRLRIAVRVLMRIAEENGRDGRAEYLAIKELMSQS